MKRRYNNDDIFPMKSVYDMQTTNSMDITNEHDIIKFVSSIHAPISLDKVVSPDLKLATFKKREKVYILNQIEGASVVRRIVREMYGEKPAENIFSSMTIPVQMMGVLNVNDKDNFMLKAILTGKTDADEDEDENGLTETRTKKKKKRKHKFDDDDNDEEDDEE